MGFFRMSPGFVNAQNRNLMMNNLAPSTGPSTPNTTHGFMVTPQNGSAYSIGRMYIMKGTVPTDFTTLTSFNARASDALILFNASADQSTNPVGNAFLPSQDSVNPIIISTIYINALASGVATWFWWMVGRADNLNFNPAAPIDNQIVGTVGISGADLNLPSVNITVGSPYRVFDYRWQIPTEWTY